MTPYDGRRVYVDDFREGVKRHRWRFSHGRQVRCVDCGCPLGRDTFLRGSDGWFCKPVPKPVRGRGRSV